MSDKVEKLDLNETSSEYWAEKRRDHRMRHTAHHSVHNLNRETREALFVITSYFNSWRYRSRPDLLWDFQDYAQRSGAQLVVVELALGERPFIVTDPDNPFHVRVRTDNELFYKENLLNLGVQRVPLSCRYLAFVDADCVFTNPRWVDETIQYLQHYPVIQMFSSASNLGPTHEVLDNFKSLIWAYQNDKLDEINNRYYWKDFHPGFAWAYVRSCLDSLGTLLECSISGSADRQMGLSLIDKVQFSYPTGISKDYEDEILMWAVRAKEFVNGNVGCLPGSLLHQFHSNKKFRAYGSRWDILTSTGFSPRLDLKKDTQGIWQFTSRSPELKYKLRKYFENLNGDDIRVNG